MFVGKYNKTIIVTYLGVAAAIIGCYFAIIESNSRYALLCLVFAGICDLFDGKIARMCKRDDEEKAFGVELDALADMVGFVFLPMCIFYSLGLNEWYHVAIYVFYTLAAITRLAFFNITVKGESDEPVKYYNGLPVTSVSIILPVFWLLSLIVDNGLFINIYTVVVALISLLFVLNVKLPKAMGIFYIIFPILALVAVFILLFVGV